MPVANFDTPEGEEVEIDSDDVVRVKPGPDPDTTVIELEDGDEIIVVASQLEVAAELELDPLEVVDALVEEDDPGDDIDER